MTDVSMVRWNVSETTTPKRDCKHTDCSLPSRKYGYCDAHAAQFRRTGSTWNLQTPQAFCDWVDCDERVHSHTSHRCQEHYGRCAVSVDGEWCDKTTVYADGKARLVCAMHNRRKQVQGEYGPLGRDYRSDRMGYVGEWRVDSEGYISRNERAQGERKARMVKQHRVVMEEYLGRALLPGENVHHINGVRTDNRIENLELWSTKQPCGQRVEDKLAWANEIIALYTDYANPSKKDGS